MKILAIETATFICGVAYIKDSNCVNLVERECPRTSAEELPGMVKNVKKKSVVSKILVFFVKFIKEDLETTRS